MSTLLRVYLFGAPPIELNHQHIEIQRRKTLALFAYLVVTRQLHSRDFLATLIWLEHDQASAHANLRREIGVRIVSGFQAIDVREHARRITQPTLVLHASGDMRIPFEEGRLMAARIPRARLVTLESNNHILLEHEPAWTRFLGEANSFLKDEEE